MRRKSAGRNVYQGRCIVLAERLRLTIPSPPALSKMFAATRMSISHGAEYAPQLERLTLNISVKFSFQMEIF